MAAFVPREVVGQVVAARIPALRGKHEVAGHEIASEDADLRHPEADALAGALRTIRRQIPRLPVPVGEPQFVDEVRTQRARQRPDALVGPVRVRAPVRGQIALAGRGREAFIAVVRVAQERHVLVVQANVESRAHLGAVERARKDAAELREVRRARLDREDAVLVVVLQIREEEQPVL